MLLTALAYTDTDLPYHHMMDGYGAWGYGLFSIVPFWIVVIVVVVVALRMSRGHWTRHSHREPIDILKERYAKGEIDKEEFEEKKKDLNL